MCRIGAEKNLKSDEKNKIVRVLNSEKVEIMTFKDILDGNFQFH